MLSQINIQDIKAFHAAINIASNQAQKGKLATFGIVPTDANTGYGYIKASIRWYWWCAKKINWCN